MTHPGGRPRAPILVSLTLLFSAVLIPETPEPASPTTGPAVPPFIVVPKGARDVKTHPDPLDSAGLSVSYKVSVAYPAADLIAEARQRLEGAGWTAMPREHVVSRNPSSLRVGWRSHVVDTSKEKIESYVWSAEWANTTGDLVGYTLMYKSGPPAPGREGAKPDNDELSVSAQLEPKKLLRADALPASLIVLDGARDIEATRQPAIDGAVFAADGTVTMSRDPKKSSTRTKLVYTLAAPRPPTRVMTDLDERLAGQGWTPAAQDAPRWLSAEEWAKSHKPGWNASESKPYDTLQEWRAMWRNERGDTLDYLLSHSVPRGASGADSAEVDYYVEAYLRLGSGKPASKAQLQPTAVPTPRSGAEIEAKIEPAYRKSDYDELVGLLRESRSGGGAVLERYRAAGGRGAPLAQGIVAVMYEEGIGVEKDAKQANEWFRKAADQGDATAQKYLGDNYRRGIGLPRSATEAIRWYAKAAEQGDGTGHAMIGRMYERGDGVLPDPASAYAWFTLGIASSDGTIRDGIRFSRKRLAAGMTASAVAQGEALAAGGIAGLPRGESPGDLAWRAVELDNSIWVVDMMFSKGPKGTLQLAGEKVTGDNGKEVLERLRRERRDLGEKLQATESRELAGDYELRVSANDECQVTKSKNGASMNEPVRVVGKNHQIEFQGKGLKGCGVTAGDVIVLRPQCDGTTPFRLFGRAAEEGLLMAIWDTSSDNHCFLGTLAKSSGPR